MEARANLSAILFRELLNSQQKQNKNLSQPNIIISTSLTAQVKNVVWIFLRKRLKTESTAPQKYFNI